MTIDAVNMLADAHIQLVRDQPAVFADANASGHLNNAANYLAVVGPKDDDGARERAGFYTERVVLAATLRGLGTCWVGGSWDRSEAARHCRLSAGEELYLGVVIGFRNGTSTAWRRAMPSWWRSAMRTASRRPTSSSPRR